MTDKENQAHELVKNKEWSKAIQIYDQILSPSTNNFKIPKDKIMACLFGRIECYLELNKYENVVQDSRRLLKMLVTENDLNNTITKTYLHLICSLYKLKKYHDAELICKDWLNSNYSPPINSDIYKLLERYRTVIQMANGQKVNQKIISQQRLDDEMNLIDQKLEKITIQNYTNDRISKLISNNSDSSIINNSSNSNNLSISSTSSTSSSSSNHSTNQFNNNSNSNLNNLSTSLSTTPIAQSASSSSSSTNNSVIVHNYQTQMEHLHKMDSFMDGGSDDGNIVCSYCAITFSDRSELRSHCQTESHQTVIMSDEGRDWKWRPPPRGYAADSYSLCESFVENSVCHYGNQCVEAHGVEELIEWKERFEYRKMKLQRACEKELYGKSYTEQLLEKWIQAASPDKIMKERLEGIEETCSNDLVTTVSSKVSKREWTFVLKTKRLLKAVALLQDTHRNHFTIKQVFSSEPRSNTQTKRTGQNSSGNGGNNISGSKVVEGELTSDQEWVVPLPNYRYIEPPTEMSPVLEHRVKVIFSTDIYGTFRQSVVFDFGSEPVLVKHICVDVIPVADADKIQEIKKEIVLSTAERWTEENSNLVEFSTTLLHHLQAPGYANDIEREKELLERYPCPKAATFTLTQSTIMEKRLTKNNYRNRIHELLYVEEIARYEQVARYNLTTKLSIVTNYLLTPSGMATSTAKYSHSGELFGLMTLGKDVSEDTSAGRLILNNCTTVYLASPEPPTNNEKRKVYEALIEDKGKNMIYLKLSAESVTGLGLKAEHDFKADVQFQLNRLSYCEWHHAVDKIADFRLIFPETYLEPSIPWTPKKQWSDTLDSKLNLKQKEAVVAITTPTSILLPPILLIGPFGTGKTYTLAQAIKQLLRQPDAKILICTHSNSAADLYIKDYLHPWVEEGFEESRPLRVYYHKRWVATVNTIVQKYCLIETTGNVRNFRRPTMEDILKYRIVVVTLSISMELASLDLPKGHFTHILLDEAAQAMECEAIMPLALAGETTRIVLAGDHMQMSPELFSNFAKERKLHVSLLERLYDHYPTDFPCKILLCENYRAHEAIIKFTSELFYDQKLIASGKQPKHEKFYPLTFFTTRGEDVQDKNSTAFYNNSEVYEVVERVCELRKKWPSTWGKINDQSIGIMTPYADQVFRIRSELRKRRMGGISVERVLNVQGKQFRAIFLSTVRTRRTCTTNNISNQSDDMDFGFLSNSKLLNTAITRAQSLVAVVGDPVALCSIGRCRKVWERFLEICNQNKSLFGITWSLLRSQLDGVEMKKTYVLNPLAPEFIPRALQAEAYIKDQQASMVGQYHQNQQQNQVQNQLQMQSQMSGYGSGIVGSNGGLYQNSQNNMNSQIRPLMGGTNHHQMPPYVGGQGQPPPPPPPQSQQQYQYPFYYYQQQQQQQQQQQMLRPPAQQPPPIGPPPQGKFPPPNNSSNLWGPSPFQVAPPNTGNVNNSTVATGGWQQQKPPNLPPPPIRPQQLNINLNIPSRPQIPQPRSPGSQQLPLGFPKLPFIVQPPNYLRNITGPMSPAFQQQQQQQMTIPPDQHISPLTNDIMASITARASQVQQQHPGVVPGLPKVPLTPDQLRHSEKDIQFLQNVHFPERGLSHLPLGSGANIGINPGLYSHHPNDYSHLLPPGMSFYEMALEAKEYQFNWYVKLLETQGRDAANKFTEILRQIPTSLSTYDRQKSIGSSNSTREQTTQNAGQSSISSQVDLVFDSIMSGTSINQPGLRDLLGIGVPNNSGVNPNPSQQPIISNMTQYASSNLMNMIPRSNQSAQQQQQQQQQSQIQQQLQPPQQSQPQIPITEQQMQQSSNEYTLPNQKLSDPHQSVPLYRRQAGQQFNGSTPTSSNNQSVSSSTPDSLENHLFETMDKIHGGTILNHVFHQDQMLHGNNGGNAGLPSIQSLAAGLQAHVFHNNITQPSHHQMHHHQHPLNHQQTLHNIQNNLDYRDTTNNVDDFMMNRQNAGSSTVTYASVLSQGAQTQHNNVQQNHSNILQNHINQYLSNNKQQNQHQDDKDPFSAIRELGQRSNGYYNYFQ